MNHKIKMLEKLADMMHESKAGRIKGYKKPAVSIEIHKHDDELPEDTLHDGMDDPMKESDEELVAEGVDRKHLFHKMGK